MEPFSPHTNLAHARRFRGTLLLVMGICLLFSFGLLAAGVDDHRLFVEWDSSAKQRLHQHARENDGTRVFFQYLTHLGSSRVLISGVVIIATVLLVLRCGRLAAIWLIATLGGFKGIDLLKDAYARARPTFLDPFVHESSLSFPSGHAAGSALFYGFLSYLLIRATYNAGWIVAPILFSVVVLVSFSRVYLGAHWASDVICGVTLGSGLAFMGMSAAEYTREF